MQHFFQSASVLIAILKRTKKKFSGEFFNKFFIFFFFASILEALVAQKNESRSGISSSSCNNVARKYSFSLEKKINKEQEFAISGFREMCKQLSNIVDEIYVCFAVAAARRRFTVCGTFDLSEL